MSARAAVPRGARAALIVAAAGVLAISATAALGGATSQTRSSADTNVTRGPLTSQLHATGTLQYLAQPDGSPYTVVDHSDGALTALPGIGQVIDQGEVLFRVADQPVVLLNGTTPAYRSLSAGDTGPDVRQLNADLVALRYASSSELNPSSDYFSTSTATALEKLQARLGVTESGTLPLGQAVFLPAPVRITAVNATLGTAYRPDSSGASPGAARAEFVDFSPGAPQPVDPAPGDRRKCKPHKQHKCRHPRRGQHHKHKHHKPGKPPKPGRPGQRGPRPGAGGAPGAKTPGAAGKPGSGTGSPHSPGGGSGRPGGGAPATPPARPILQATSTRRVVVVQLDARAARRAKVGQHASITLPSGRATSGEIARIGTTADTSGAVPVYINLAHPGVAGDLDQAPVQVQITTAAVASALRVPITALVARSGTQFAVRTVGARGVTHLVPVQVGIFDDASGLVQVVGALMPGERVVEPQD